MRLVQLYGSDPHRLQPIGIRFGDVVFAANIGALNTSDALATLAAILDEAGVSLTGVARVTAYVRTAAEREPVYGPWDALFPDPADRPALKVLLAPLPEGSAIRLDALALVDGRRERVDVPGVPARDPTVKVGDWVLTSRVHGTDPATGKVATGGLEAEARQALANIGTLTAGADISQLTGFVRDEPAAAVLRQTVSGAPLAILTNFVPPSMNLMLEAIAGTPHVREIFVDGAIPAAITIGDLFFAPAIDPTAGDDFQSQLRSGLERMDATLAAAGLSRANVAHVSIYFPSMDLKPILNQVWSEWFPDPADRPPHIYVPYVLPAGQQVQLQVFAALGSEREVLEIAGLVHGDPMSMGVRMGGHVFSSRVFAGANGASADALAQARVVFANVEALLAQAGASRSDLSQINAFVGSDADAAAAQAVFDEMFASPPRPVFRLLPVNLSGATTVRLEVISNA